MYRPASLEHCEQDLRNCYRDATRKGGLIDFSRKVRTDANDLSGKYSIHRDDIAALFSASVWRDCKKAGGHRKVANIVTGVIIEYPNHHNQSGIDPGVVETLLDRICKHLNILSNTVFDYRTHNWKYEPDYVASARRLLTQSNSSIN
jgi:hypothetical protein